MENADKLLKKAAYSVVSVSSADIVKDSDNADKEDNVANSCHLLYMYKVNLPQHPVRMRLLPHTSQRMLLYGQKGYQEVTVDESTQLYSLQEISWQIQMCDCVQTNDALLYVVSRSHSSAIIACYDELMMSQKVVEVSYPLGCLSSIAVNHNGTYLYGTNQELNCLLRFEPHDLSLSNAERFGALWRPFDCCPSQLFQLPNGDELQYLFVSNVDAGILVFELNTMDIVAECGSDLSPGAKFLAYDPKRSLVFVSSSYDRFLCCYKFSAPKQLGAPPMLEKIGKFLVAKVKPKLRTSGPQCVMWDTDLDQLVVISRSHVRGEFMSKVFRVNV